MVLKLCHNSRSNVSPGNLEGADQPKNGADDSAEICVREYQGWPEDEEDDLNPTDDGEASEEAHGASNETQLGLRLDLLVSLDVVKGGRVKVDLHQFEGWWLL